MGREVGTGEEWEQVMGIWLEGGCPGAHLEIVKISITCTKELSVPVELGALNRIAR